MLESSFGLFSIASSSLPLLELRVYLVSFGAIEEQKFLVDQNTVETGPTGLERVVLAEVVIMLKFEIVLSTSSQLDVQCLHFVVGAGSRLLAIIICRWRVTVTSTWDALLN